MNLSEVMQRIAEVPNTWRGFPVSLTKWCGARALVGWPAAGVRSEI